MDQHPHGNVDQLAGLGSRIGAFLIDSILVGIVTFALIFIFGLLGVAAGGTEGMALVGGLLNIVLPVLMFGYYIMMEAVYGYTFGKLALGLVVVGENGNAIGWGESIIRNLLRIVDTLPFAYIVGIIMILLTDNEQRVGDLAGSTLVVKQS